MHVKSFRSGVRAVKAGMLLLLPVFPSHAVPMLVLLQQQGYSKARGAMGSNSSPNHVPRELSMGMSPWKLGFLVSQLPFLHMLFQPCWDV